jgi:hypothetical protein
VITEEKRTYNKKYYEANKDRLRDQNKTYREEHKEELAQASKEHYQDNKESIREKQAEYSKTYAPRSRDLKLAKNGWTQELYDSKFVEQEGLCAICKIPTAPLCTGGLLAADHEHINPPKPRGLLCSRCNTGLGQFLDNPLLLMEAVMYLAKYGVPSYA